jgi:hypothetical protein
VRSEEGIHPVTVHTQKGLVLCFKPLRALRLRVRQSFSLAVKKLSTMKSIPDQTLIRHWIVEGLKHELESVLK